MAQQAKNLTSCPWGFGFDPGLWTSGLRIQCCRTLWPRPTMWLGSCIAVAVVEAGSCNSNSTPSLGTSICHRCGHKRRKKEDKTAEVRFMPHSPRGGIKVSWAIWDHVLLKIIPSAYRSPHPPSNLVRGNHSGEGWVDQEMQGNSAWEGQLGQKLCHPCQAKTRFSLPGQTEE